MQFGQYHLNGRHHLAIAYVHQIHRNAAAIIDNSDGVVHVNHDFDPLAVAGQRFVHGIVDYFVHQVMKSHLAGRADVHCGAQTNGLETFKNFDVLAGISAVVAGTACEGILIRYVDCHCLSRHRIPFAVLFVAGPGREGRFRIAIPVRNRGLTV